MLSNRVWSFGAPPRPGGLERLFVHRYSNDEMMAEKPKILSVGIADESSNA
jgi:hypothetical protein